MRYVLREGETWEENTRYARNVRSLRPLLKSVLQRYAFCVVVDSTFKTDLPVVNLMPEVMVVNMPLSRIPEIAGMVVAIIAPELMGSLKEPPPQGVIFANPIDHMACEGLLLEVNGAMQDVQHPKRAAQLLTVVANAMEIAIEILRDQIGVSALSVSSPCLMYWERTFQRFVYLLTEVCKSRRIDVAIWAPNLRVNNEDFRPAALSNHGYLAAVS